MSVYCCVYNNNIHNHQPNTTKLIVQIFQLQTSKTSCYSKQFFNDYARYYVN